MNKNLKLKFQKIALMLMTITLIISTGEFVLPSNAFACSCAYRPDPEKALEKTEAVFSGEVIDIKQEVFEEDGIYEYRNAALFKVNQMWKGITRSETIIRTFAGGSSACGNEYEVGKTYLVFANENKNLNVLETSICSLTKEASTANVEFLQLGQGKDSLEAINLKSTMANMKYKNILVYSKGILIRLLKHRIILGTSGGIVVLFASFIWFKNRRKT